MREKILDDPDLGGADSHRWEKHLKEEKTAKVMVTEGHQTDPNPLDPHPNNYPANPYPGYYDGLQATPMPSWGGNMGPGRGRARGRGGSVGVKGAPACRRGAPGAGRGWRGVYWICGQPGHWARDCYQQQPQQYTGQLQWGRGGSQYQAPNPHMTPGPRPQFPTWEAGWDRQQWMQ